MCTQGIRGQVSIDTFDRYRQSTVDQYLINTPLTQQVVKSWLIIINRSIQVSWHLASYRPTVDQAFSEMLIESWSSVYRISIGMSIEYQLSIDQHTTADAFSTHDPNITDM